ncbi:SWI/SNF chromatin-remodeling complex subunit [Coemansia asiatica]|uniref:SWI/SNF chromatin-remodeling complex subunit n=1 Tax=Coemansia asiatica TaxID=1052880 RepID=A0A9W7XGR2_9FUNG|nr:SWI/SNF chromatin-remodeling complex subunit [Coemansia asiatica]
MQAQMAITAMVPNFMQLPIQLQMNLMGLFNQQRALVALANQLTAGLQSQGTTPQQRATYLAQMHQVQGTMTSFSQQFQQQINYAKSFAGLPQQMPPGVANGMAAINGSSQSLAIGMGAISAGSDMSQQLAASLGNATGDASAAASNIAAAASTATNGASNQAASSASGSTFFRQDGSSGNVSEPTPLQTAQQQGTPQQMKKTQSLQAGNALSSALVSPLAAGAGLGGGLSQSEQKPNLAMASTASASATIVNPAPAQQKQISVAVSAAQRSPANGLGSTINQQQQQQQQAVNFYMAPPAPPAVIPVDKITGILDEEQKGQLAAWQKEADRIARSNQFRARETAGYQMREEAYRKILEAQRHQNVEMAQETARERELEKHLFSKPMAWGPGYSGYGNGQTLPPLASHGGRAAGVPLAPNLQEALVVGGTVPQAAAARWVAPVALIMPAQRKLAPGRLPTLRFSRRQLRRQAEQKEVLVPIRLDLDADGFRLRDTFTWDLNNELITPQRFAQHLCVDLELPAESFVAPIVQAIEEQLDDFRQYGHVMESKPSVLRQMLLDEYASAKRLCSAKEEEGVKIEEIRADDEEAKADENPKGLVDGPVQSEAEGPSAAAAPIEPKVSEPKPGSESESESDSGSKSGCGVPGHDSDLSDHEHEHDRARSPSNDDVAVPSSAFVSGSSPAPASVDNAVLPAAKDSECTDSHSVAENKVDKDDELVWVDDELRVVIRIDIIIGHIALRDQFEWDVAPLLRPLDASDLRDQFLALLEEESQRVPPSNRDLVEANRSGSGSGSAKDNVDDDDDDDVPMSSAAFSEHGPFSEKAEATDDLDNNSEQSVREEEEEEEAGLLRQWVHGAIEGQLVTPEQVSRVICAEKGLGGEFETAIAHAIREQLYAFVKSFLLAGYTYHPHMMTRKQAQMQATRIQQRLIQIDDKELARSILPPVVSVERDLGATQTFAPLIAHLHTVDAERLEKDSERETRRKRRQGRGRGRAGAAAGGGGGASGLTPSGAGALGALLPPDREVHRTNRTMIALPSWFDDELPPDTRSFVETPGEGAHFLDSYEMRANYEAQSLAAIGNGSAPAAIAALGSAGAIFAVSGAAPGSGTINSSSGGGGGVSGPLLLSGGIAGSGTGAFDYPGNLGMAGAGIDDLSGLRRGAAASLAFAGSSSAGIGSGAFPSFSSQLLGRRYASGSGAAAAAAAGSGAFLSNLDFGMGGVYSGSVASGTHYGLGASAASPSMMIAASPSAHSTSASPVQIAREKLRNPTGRPRGRPSILEKALRDASADRMARVAKMGGDAQRKAKDGAIPGQLSGRPLEELVAKWRCMSCGLTPDRTPLIRRGPESMHSLCDQCGQVYVDSRRLPGVDLAVINGNLAHRCGKLAVPRSDDAFVNGPDVSVPGSPLPPPPLHREGENDGAENVRESTLMSTEDDVDSKDFSASEDTMNIAAASAVPTPSDIADSKVDDDDDDDVVNEDLF